MRSSRSFAASDRLQLDVPLVERPHKVDSLVDIGRPEKDLVQPLGILGIELKPDMAGRCRTCAFPRA